ncbi:MAG: hypothetical protein ACRCT8_02475 [Lacipirellulaceae bacterium]
MASEVSPLVTMYRFTVMTGTLVVGSMAAYRYGPPADQLADIIDSVASRAFELAGDEPPADAAQLSAVAAGAPLVVDPFAQDALIAVTSEPTPPSFVTPASAELPIAAGGDPAASDGAVASLEALGATRVVVTPWGTSGLAYRVHAETPAPTHDGMTQQFDAIGETTAAAAAEVASQMEQARVVR